MDNNDELNMNIDFELFDAMQAGKESDFSVSSDDTAEIPHNSMGQNDRATLKNQFFSSATNRTSDENESFQMSASDADFFKSALAQAELDRTESSYSSARQTQTDPNRTRRSEIPQNEINRDKMDRAALLQLAREQSSQSPNSKTIPSDRRIRSLEPSEPRPTMTDFKRTEAMESATSRSGLFSSSLFRSSNSSLNPSVTGSLASESAPARSLPREVINRSAALNRTDLDRATVLASAQEQFVPRKSEISNSLDERDHYSSETASFSVSSQKGEKALLPKRSLYNTGTSSTSSTGTLHKRKKRNRFVTFCRTIFLLTFLTLGTWALYGVGLSDQEGFWSNVFEKQLSYVKNAVGSGPQFFPFAMWNKDFNAYGSKNFKKDDSVQCDSNDSNSDDSISDQTTK